MDNSEIARIAAADLEPDVLDLLERYRENAHVTFFLGRLAWQGKMTKAVPALLAIARDPSRGLYARIASARAVMAAGDDTQREALWSDFAAEPGPLDRRLFAEIVRGAAPTVRSVELLLATLARLEPYERFSVTGLEQALHGFIERLPIMIDHFPEQPLVRLVEGLNLLLETRPCLSERVTAVSREFAWLMGPAVHAVERLVGKRAAAARDAAAIGIMLKLPSLRYHSNERGSEYKTQLGSWVPAWRELNDDLYWASIAEQRSRAEAKGDRVTSDHYVAVLGFFWRLDAGDFERCLDWIGNRGTIDDRLVALSRCLTLYFQADRPTSWLAALRGAAAGQPELTAALELSLDPPKRADVEEVRAEQRAWQRRDEREKRRDERQRAAWIAELRADPGRVVKPIGVEPGLLTGDQLHLMSAASDETSHSRHADGADWRRLIPEFGVEVAESFRDAAIRHWRHYTPALRSEGADTSSIPYAVVLGLFGLAFEIGHDGAAANGLSASEAEQAFRYTTWELNGFPGWIEALYRAHPEPGKRAILKELEWELDQSEPEGPQHYILHDIVYHAPWLYADIAPTMLRWLEANDMPNASGLRYCIAILRRSGVDPGQLSALVARKLARKEESGRPEWYAFWTDVDPERAIPSLEAELEAMEAKDAPDFAQHFVLSLLGERFGGNPSYRIGEFRTTGHLKRLYLLMHRFIRADEDLRRAGTGVFTPTTRDDAQRARDRLFGMIAEAPGNEAYFAMRALADEHPDVRYRQSMLDRASHRATQDADEPAWEAAKVWTFAKAILDGGADAAPSV